ncbi:MAG: hypothetical protein ACRC33_15580, partial [Gemmataceae bacterium]
LTREGHPSPAGWHQHATESLPARWLLRGLAPSRSAWYASRGRLPGPRGGPHGGDRGRPRRHPRGRRLDPPPPPVSKPNAQEECPKGRFTYLTARDGYG